MFLSHKDVAMSEAELLVSPQQDQGLGVYSALQIAQQKLFILPRFVQALDIATKSMISCGVKK